MIKIPLYGYNPDTLVMVEDDEGSVLLGGTSQSERDNDGWDRNLTPSEARALAAALFHYAQEAER